MLTLWDSAIVGNSIPIGVGLGLSHKLKNKNFISTIFIGEGATEEGVFFESLNFSIMSYLFYLFVKIIYILFTLH